MAKNKTYKRDGRAPIPVNETTSRLMSKNKSKNTKPELILRKEMWRNGVRGYRLHWKKAPGKPDIAFPGRRIAIFVNGCFWHRCPNCEPQMPKSNVEFWKNKFEKNVERDKKKLEQLAENGWQTITIWECQIKDDVTEQVERIKQILYTKEDQG
jgi:DNA mismatch endonuclease (patch repair protein)